MTRSEQLDMLVVDRNDTSHCEINIDTLVIAGWTGRDKEATEAHIAELEALGVARPSRTPMFYRVAASRLTTATEIEVLGDQATGEVEPVLIKWGGRVFVGCGSDHTDRRVESYSVAVSKQICEKPLAGTLWLLDEVYPQWDQLMLRSYAVLNGERRLYQEGPVAGIMDPKALVEHFESEGGRFEEGVAMFCGTIATHGGVGYAERFEYELVDMVNDRSIGSYYDVHALPLAE